MTKITVRWLIPFPIVASGGHQTIYAHMGRMVADGIDCIACVDMREVSSPFISRKERTRELSRKLGELGITVELGHESIKKRSDLVVATSWRTAYDVAACQSPRKAYFIQDYEPWFYAHGDSYLRAENSYRLGLAPVVLGNWLTEKVGALSDNLPHKIPFSVDTKIYFRSENLPRSKSICYLHQPEKPRRCSALAQAALRSVQNRRPDIEIWSYGSKRKPNIRTRRFSIISREACAELYNKASVGFCISASNPSRIPFEMAACGLRVVDIDAENTRQDALSNYSILADPEHIALANALIQAVDETWAGHCNGLPAYDATVDNELDRGAEAFHKILQTAPYKVRAANDVSSTIAANWAQRLREKLVRSYIAFFEE